MIDYAFKSAVLVPAALIPLLIVAPAGALVDDEPANDSIATAAIQMVKTGAVTTQGGKLSFDPTDTDYLGVGGLIAGDIVTISTTPLDDPPSLEDPDTIVGLFKCGHWMDFDRLAREFLLVDLSTIAYFFMLASAAPLVISLALYCTRDRWVPALGRLLSPNPES